MREYDARIGACIHVDAPDSARAAMLTTSYNAGTAAVCRSPMVAKINAGDFKGACAALPTKDKNGNYNGWYIRAQGKIVRGLINRRRDDQKVCFSGVNEKPNASSDAVVRKALDALPAKLKEPPPPADQVLVKRYQGSSAKGEYVDVMPKAPPEGPPCYGQFVDDGTYTSHPECRAPAKPAPARPAWYKWIFK